MGVPFFMMTNDSLLFLSIPPSVVPQVDTTLYYLLYIYYIYYIIYNKYILSI